MIFFRFVFLFSFAPLKGEYIALFVVQDSELSKDGVSFAVYTNTGVEESNVALIALKNIFSRQLPKMPKDYIVRLVFDQRHLTLAIKVNSVIIGGICYRPYHFLRFGEIAFCAINGSDQVRGYGTKLMNALKAYVQKYSKFIRSVVCHLHT